jgi:SnoaL-like domain
MTLIPKEIANFFNAMQAGRAGAAEMEAVFAEDAVYIEPFSGQVQQHVGKPAIMAAMARGWDYPLPDMRITIDRVESTEGDIRVSWTCHSPGLPGGRGQGENRYRMQADGRIAELETTLDAGAAP